MMMMMMMMMRRRRRRRIMRGWWFFSAVTSGYGHKLPNQSPPALRQLQLVGGDWNMTFIVPYIGNNHPNWQLFFRGVEATNQSRNQLLDPFFAKGYRLSGRNPSYYILPQENLMRPLCLSSWLDQEKEKGIRYKSGLASFDLWSFNVLTRNQQDLTQNRRHIWGTQTQNKGYIKG